MQGRKDNEGSLFSIVMPSRLVPVDHPVGRLSELMDLSYLCGQTRPYYSHEGKPSIDPVVLFKLYLLGCFSESRGRGDCFGKSR
jgi:hypothetical protein